MLNVTPSVMPQLRGAVFQGGLQARVIGRAENMPDLSWAGLLLEDGAAQLSDGETVQDLKAPVFVWQPWGSDKRIKLAAGAVGAYVLVGATTLSNAIGHQPESRDLREMADLSLSVSLDDNRSSLTKLHNCFSEVCNEIQTDRPASRTVIESYLRILLIEVWRSRSHQSETTSRLSPSQRIFSRFIDLIDRHFRDRWNVQDYAKALGVSRDRLVDICARVRNSTPKAIIDRRVTLEAQLLLEHSSYSIEQISYQLGFQAAAQFSRFFSRSLGQPPGKYRAARQDQPPDGQIQGELHDWP